MPFYVKTTKKNYIINLGISLGYTLIMLIIGLIRGVEIVLVPFSFIFCFRIFEWILTRKAILTLYFPIEEKPITTPLVNLFCFICFTYVIVFQ